MSEFKGTKGKWEYHRDEDTYDCMYQIISGVYVLGLTPSDDEEDFANAVLISKAPEMLEMLKELISENTWENTLFDKKQKAKKLIKEATES